ncbi:MAG: hypothetical protein NT145_06230, partial [Elusimicrobia bacterium]|nr:hypothetical protein [Elusimicrobiota bacterium]
QKREEAEDLGLEFGAGKTIFYKTNPQSIISGKIPAELTELVIKPGREAINNTRNPLDRSPLKRKYIAVSGNLGKDVDFILESGLNAVSIESMPEETNKENLKTLFNKVEFNGTNITVYWAAYKTKNNKILIKLFYDAPLDQRIPARIVDEINKNPVIQHQLHMPDKIAVYITDSYSYGEEISDILINVLTVVKNPLEESSVVKNSKFWDLETNKLNLYEISDLYTRLAERLRVTNAAKIPACLVTVRNIVSLNIESIRKFKGLGFDTIVLDTQITGAEAPNKDLRKSVFEWIKSCDMMAIAKISYVEGEDIFKKIDDVISAGCDGIRLDLQELGTNIEKIKEVLARATKSRPNIHIGVIFSKDLGDDKVDAIINNYKNVLAAQIFSVIDIEQGKKPRRGSWLIVNDSLTEEDVDYTIDASKQKAQGLLIESAQKANVIDISEDFLGQLQGEETLFELSNFLTQIFDAVKNANSRYQYSLGFNNALTKKGEEIFADSNRKEMLLIAKEYRTNEYLKDSNFVSRLLKCMENMGVACRAEKILADYKDKGYDLNNKTDSFKKAEEKAAVSYLIGHIMGKIKVLAEKYLSTPFDKEDKNALFIEAVTGILIFSTDIPEENSISAIYGTVMKNNNNLETRVLKREIASTITKLERMRKDRNISSLKFYSEMDTAIKALADELKSPSIEKGSPSYMLVLSGILKLLDAFAERKISFLDALEKTTKTILPEAIKAIQMAS